MSEGSGVEGNATDVRNGAADDPQAFLLANCMSLGQSNAKSTEMDFDMEWAYYCLKDDEMEWAYYCLKDDDEKKPEGGKGKPNPMNQELAVANQLQEAPDVKRKLSEEDGDEDAEGKRSKGKATWRKYGQKTLKGKEYVGMRVLRCYYHCNFPGCTVRKAIHSNRLYPSMATVKIITPLVEAPISYSVEAPITLYHPRVPGKETS